MYRITKYLLLLKNRHIKAVHLDIFLPLHPPHQYFQKGALELGVFQALFNVLLSPIMPFIVFLKERISSVLDARENVSARHI
jgi:hypothetical protein